MKYTPFEIEKMLESMVVLVDTREQPGRRFQQRAKGFGYPFERCKLDFGDYSCKYTDLSGNEISLDGKVSIERKMDLSELAMCFGKERLRFRREFERAAAAGAKVYLLIENDSWDKEYIGEYGKSEKYRSRFDPKALRASMLAWSARYNIHIHYCDEDIAGMLIGEILHYELKVLLEGEKCQRSKI